MGKNNVVYFWVREWSEGQSFVNQQSILNSIRNTHLIKDGDNDQVLKINQGAYQKISTVASRWFGLAIERYTVSEIVQFVLQRAQGEKNKRANYELYVIHHCQNNEIIDGNNRVLKWLHVQISIYSMYKNIVLWRKVPDTRSSLQLPNNYHTGG